ncbi:hypothetical protein HYC85_015032 [Camellia sinensis]|uniref:Uncharacterized protein n=1 Tax=Camellia sinensis TaxID=4442 RepID=A0A7J7H908_CAMSI|nr:hypothetical protein HYC85_015032 [Camellia sinensis]
MCCANPDVFFLLGAGDGTATAGGEEAGTGGATAGAVARETAGVDDTGAGTVGVVGAVAGGTEMLELKLGLGGTSYEDFIRSLHLPMQLSEVDPIVASFSGGAVGVISALMVVEINNVKQQEDKRCKYCLGTGYLACARCSSSGALVLIEPESTVNARDQPLSPPKTERCSNCSGAGKVMCPTCLCTGMAMASEHDPRIDPFD